MPITDLFFFPPSSPPPTTSHAVNSAKLVVLCCQNKSLPLSYECGYSARLHVENLGDVFSLHFHLSLLFLPLHAL